MIPITAQAGNNYQTQQIILNNFNNAEQNLANQVNSYVSSGQLSPQQGAVFNGELNQISSQSLAGATNPAVTVLVMNELNSLAAQINASLGGPGQWMAPPVYGSVRGPGRYSWRPRSGGFQHNAAGQRQLQSNHASEQQQLQVQQSQARTGMEHQIQANNRIEHASVAPARAATEHQQAAGRMIAHANGARPQTQPKANESREVHR
jgi:hypothetical protein